MIAVSVVASWAIIVLAVIGVWAVFGILKITFAMIDVWQEGRRRG